MIFNWAISGLFIFSIQLTVNVNINLCRCLDSNLGPQESEATALPTEPQPQLDCLMVKFNTEWPIRL